MAHVYTLVGHIQKNTSAPFSQKIINGCRNDMPTEACSIPANRSVVVSIQRCSWPCACACSKLVLFVSVVVRGGAETTARGFEPLRAEPSGFLVHHLNHSVTLSMSFLMLGMFVGVIPITRTKCGK